MMSVLSSIQILHKYLKQKHVGVREMAAYKIRASFYLQPTASDTCILFTDVGFGKYSCISHAFLQGCW